MSAALSLRDLPESMALLPRGMYRDVPAALYHRRIPGLASKSTLDMVDRAPARYEAWLGGTDGESSEALEFGAALHSGMLEPAEYERLYVAAPDHGDQRFKENKAKRAAWAAKHAGKKLLSAEDASTIAGMCRAVRAHPTAAGLLVGGEAELTLRWDDPETGIYCKARTDYYVRDLATVVDVKSTEDARPEPFARSVAKYGYHVQNAIYEDAFAALGEPIEHFVFLAIEKRPPYLIGLYELDADAIERGRARARQNLLTLRECIERGVYPGYSEEIETLSLPRWAT